MTLMDDAATRIQELRSLLHLYNHQYYVLNAPTVSDREFDMLLKELETLEAAHPEYADPLSPTQRIGSDLTAGFEQVIHERPMISLANSYNMQDVDDWFSRVRTALGGEHFEVVGELKFDGTSISLLYINGELIRAVTRGDGTRGDDVTANIKTIHSIPLRLQPGSWPHEFEIRGEILLPWDEFERLNQERAYNEEPLFANPRNAASGTLKTRNPRVVAERHLDARFYSLLGNNLPTDNHYDNMLAARSWGFKVSPHMQLLHSLDDVNNFIEHWDTARRELPVATDGLVFKVNSLRQQLNLGSTAKSPRWAIAYKFNPEQACTPLRFVSFETGRMGVVTPVANLEPVLLSGTIVKRASLHNEDIIHQLDIHEGDHVYVEKGGEIIPKIVSVDKSQRIPGSRPVEFVTHCRDCGTPLVRIEGEAAWVCPNRYGCRPQITGRIEHFCARRMMDIDGIGEETAEMLYATGLVTTIADIYQLTADKLSVLDRLGEKSAKRIMDGIEASKSVPFERVVYALSIPGVGETTAKRVARHAQTMERLRSMSEEELTAIPDVGPVIARAIFDFMRLDSNIADIDALIAAGVTMSLSPEQMQPAGTTLEGKSIVISGTFLHHSRDEYKAIIEANGGKNVGSISKKTSFVLAGDNMGPSKRQKCESLGIPMISEDEFLKIVDNASGKEE
ncbi:MAG: NAD-dependent DNA ligase LigA [Muribaculaceae bacterium]|nr:NAD-dependent DNA ligase LigA [Muribaculaceae bacterium]